MAAPMHVELDEQSTRPRMDVAFVIDLQNHTHVQLRKKAWEEVMNACSILNVNCHHVQFEKLDLGEMNVLKMMYNADVALIDLSIDIQKNALFYHLGVRESFGKKENILMYNDYDTEITMPLKLSCTNYPLVTYRVLECVSCVVTKPTVVMNNGEVPEVGTRMPLVQKIKKLLQDVEIQSKAHMKERFVSERDREKALQVIRKALEKKENHVDVDPQDFGKEDGANIDHELPRKGKCAVIKTSTRQILDVNPQDLGKKDGANADLYLQRKGKCAVTKTSKQPVRFNFGSCIDFEHDNAIDFPDDLAAGLALRNLDTAISSIIRIQKILKRIKKVDSGRRQFKVQTFRHKSSFWGIIELMMLLMLTISLVSCFAVYETEKQKFCEPSFDCLNCLANGCVFVEFANRSKLCALSFNEVKGLRRRQYSLSCPQDLVPKKIADWFSIKTKFIDDEYYGYKLYVWLTIPVIGLAVMFIGFKIVRCYYHKTRYNPRLNWKRPECLRDLCKGRHRDVRDRSPSIQMDTVHYDSVSDIMESEQITNSCSGSGVESLNSSDDSDSTYSPSSISSTESPIPSTTEVPYRVLRPRKAINYSED